MSMTLTSLSIVCFVKDISNTKTLLLFYTAKTDFPYERPYKSYLPTENKFFIKAKESRAFKIQKLREGN